MKEVEVVAGIIMKANKFLVTQRGKGKYDYISYKFEFPGGKVEEEETLEEALIRELKEELGIKVKICNFFMTVNHKYPDFKLKMHSFICEIVEGEIILKEHISSKWLEKNELLPLDWAAADIPIVEKLKNQQNTTNVLYFQSNF